jgi:hypothetical protein
MIAAKRVIEFGKTNVSRMERVKLHQFAGCESLEAMEGFEVAAPEVKELVTREHLRNLTPFEQDCLIHAYGLFGEEHVGHTRLGKYMKKKYKGRKAEILASGMRIFKGRSTPYVPEVVKVALKKLKVDPIILEFR